MSLKLGDLFPDFKADSSTGMIESFYKWKGDSWAIFFSHPADFTPVCTTELARATQLYPEFNKRNVKMIAISCDTTESHRQWSKDVIAFCMHQNRGDPKCCMGEKGDCETLPFPIIDDEKRELANQLGMIDPDESQASGIPLTARAVFVLGPDNRLKLSILYPATTGRNFDEILRAIDSLQLTATKKVATPVDWKQGDDCMVLPTLKPEQVKELFGDHVETVQLPSGKGYLRKTKQPN